MDITIKTTSVGVSVNPASMSIGIGTPIARDPTDRDPYEGDYTITPTTTQQILSAKDKWMRNDITIEPIPQNYGLITWSGSVLTVS